MPVNNKKDDYVNTDIKDVLYITLNEQQTGIPLSSDIAPYGYTLYGIIYHPGAHFNVACLNNNNNNKWYLYDDTQINELITPYVENAVMCFYKKNEINTV